VRLVVVEDCEGHPVWRAGRGSHSFTFQLNVSAFCEIGGAFRGCLGGVWEASGGIRGCLGCISCQKRLRLR